MTDQTTGDPTHGLSVQHADALWDAVAIPGPTEPTFPMQHERVCRAVAEILAELTPAAPAVPVSSPPADQTNLVAVAAQAIRDSNGSPEALAWWKKYPQLIPAHVYAAAVLAVLPPADRAAVLREAADIADETVPPDLPRDDRDQGRADAAADIRRWADHVEREELRRLAAEAQQPDTETLCERCGHNRQAHNISGCTACPGGWRADHQFTSVDQPPADPWSISYHQLGAARMNPNVCTCGLGPGALTHNEPHHAFNGRPKAGMPGVYGICTDCHHHQSARCHATPDAEPPAHIGGVADDCPGDETRP